MNLASIQVMIISIFSHELKICSCHIKKNTPLEKLGINEIGFKKCINTVEDMLENVYNYKISLNRMTLNSSVQDISLYIQSRIK